MKRTWIDYLPALFAVAALLLVSVCKAMRIIPETRRDDFEAVTNAVMFGATVVSLFFVGLPSKKNSERRLGGILSNLAVSVFAFPINIVIFEHVIDWTHPQNGLWGGHVAWFLCIVMQILLLSGLGELLLDWVRKFLAWLGRRKNNFGTAFIQIVDTIKRSDKGIITILGTCVLLWVLYLAGKALTAGTMDVLAHPDTLEESILLWIVSIIAGAFAYCAPSMFRKMKASVEPLDPKKVLTAFVAATILLLLFFMLFNELGVWGGVLAVLAGAAVLVGLSLKDHNRSGTPPQNNPESHVINPKDVAIAALAFLAPLVLTGVLTILSSAGQVFITEDKTDFTIWWNFGEAYLNVAGSLLDLFT